MSGYKMMSGVTKNTAKNLLIGPGIVTKNFNAALFDPADVSTWGDFLGATKGGNTVNMDMTWYQVEPDGALGPVVGMEWLIKAAAKTSTTLLEVTKDALMMKLNVFSTRTFNDKYDKIAHNGSIAPGAVTNIAIFASLIGKSIPVVIVLENARSTDPVEVPLGDGKSEVGLKIEFEAQLAAETITTIPFYILYPKGEAEIASPSASPAPGSYPETQSVALTAVTGMDIYYTLDGSYPTPLNGFLYSAPISVATTTTINAVASKGPDTSAPVSFVYTINN